MPSICGVLEPDRLEIKIEVDERLQLDRQDLAVPAGVLRELVVGQDVGALVGFAEMREPHSWHHRHPDQLCGFGAAMSRNDLLVVIDQDRIVEPEPLDALRAICLIWRFEWVRALRA